ncbi:MAG: FAD-dependent oxidoreductase [Gammaproteobacteria bacterium]|jgi:4-cresol dehydrogenase (hydroxylating)
MALPPGVSERDFNRALERFRNIVGDEWVFSSDEDVALYRDAYSIFWGEPEERMASAAVAPHDTEQVQAVVREANEFGIPLYPISTGRNLAYGGAAPAYSGSAVLDLKRMNRVLEVNEDNAYALVEPGVSYFDLYNYIEERNLNVWIDPPDPGWGSVIGNALDGGGGWTAYPYRDHFGAHCGMEVVLGDGDIVRTGMGALPNGKTWQQNKWGYGPWVDGLFRQGNMGVVTKMGFWLMPKPEALISGTARVPNDAGATGLMNVLNLLENQGIVNGSTTLNGAPGGGWSLSLPIYGPANVIRAQLDYARTKFEEIQGATFTEDLFFPLPLSDENRQRVESGAAGGGVRNPAYFGVPNLSTFSMLGRSPFQPNPAGGHIGFSPIIPRSGEELVKFRDWYQANASDASGGENLGIIGPVFMTNWERSLVGLIMFPISKDAEHNRKIRDAFVRWVELAAAEGWAEYRAPTVYQDMIADTYSFNDNALTRMREKIKDAVDPNGIISAGRYGVWPKHLRDA